MPAPQSADVVALMVALLTALLGPRWAALLGPYVIIVLCAAFAAIVALLAQDSKERAASLWFVTSATIASFLFTSSLAQFLMRGLSSTVHIDVAETAALVIVSAAIAGSRAYWRAAAVWLVNLVRRKAEGSKP